MHPMRLNGKYLRIKEGLGDDHQVEEKSFCLDSDVPGEPPARPFWRKLKPQS